MAVLEKFPDVSESEYPRLGRVKSAPLGIDSKGLDRRSRRLAESLESLERYGQELRAILDELSRSVADIEPTPADLDQVDGWIDRLGDEIRVVAGDLRRNHPKMEREIARARALARDEPGWRVYADLLERFVNELFDLQEALDTTRTRLLGILSAHEKGHGPVMENPEDVEAYFRSILKT